jgi:hypothetical protein
MTTKVNRRITLTVELPPVEALPVGYRNHDAPFWASRIGTILRYHLLAIGLEDRHVKHVVVSDKSHVQ